MTKVPKGISIQQVRNNVTLTTSNYSDPLFLMQVMLFIPFLSIISIVFLINSPFGLLFTLPLLAATIRWTRHNQKDHYKIHLLPKRLIITKGLNKRELINTELQDIRAVYIVEKTELVPGEFAHDPIIDNKNELIIRTEYETFMITNSLVDKEQIFIRNKIIEWVKQHVKNIRLDITPSEDTDQATIYIE